MVRKNENGRTKVGKNAAERLVEALIEEGLTVFFGIPGGPACHIFDAIGRHPAARLVESRHESQAAFAAVGYYRATGRVAAVVVTSGPGITNVVTGVASASEERVPVLIVAGDVPWATTGERIAQDSGPEGIDAEAVLRPYVRICVRAAHQRSVVAQSFAALEAATDPVRPGPALFILPMDRAREIAEKVRIVRGKRTMYAAPHRADVASTAALLSTVKRPLIVFGDGCRPHAAAVARLADAAQVPFVTTLRAKGMVTERHPWSLRNGGMAASAWAKRYLASPPGACLVLGTDLDDVSMGPTRYAGKGTVVVHVDRNPAVIGRNVPTDLGIVSDLGVFAVMLERSLRGGEPRSDVRDAYETACAGSVYDESDADVDASVPIRPHRLIRDIVRAVPERSRFVSDIGGHTLFALHYLCADHPDSFLVQMGLGSMGSGIGSAVGAAVGDPTRLTVCIVGDGCMHMAGMEALVACKERLPILFIVMNDGRYNIVHHGMKAIFGSARPYDMPLVDFAAWARSIGLPSATVTSPGELSAGMVRALRSEGGPALIDARIDPSFHMKGGRVEALQRMSMSAINGD